MGLPLQSSAMTLFLFHLLVFCSEVGYTLVPDADQVAPALKVSHFDCSSMTENSLYAINQVRPCHITPEELEVSKATITLYTKHFRKELNATKCRIQHQREKWHCGHNDHSSIDHTIAGITSDLIISPEHCRTLAKGASINLQGHWIGAEWDTKTPVVKVTGDPTGSNRNHCKTRGWITRDTFIIHMQRTTLKVTMENGKVLSDMGLILPCALEELGCETTSLDPYAYIWDYPDNCVLSVLRTEEVNMVKQDTKYYVISGKDSTSKFVFEVKNNPQKHCGKPTPIYPTNYDSLYMARLSEGFDMNTGRNLGREKNGATKILQYLGPQAKNDFGQLYAHNPQLEGTQLQKADDPNSYLNMDYEMHLGTKIDYLFFQSSRLLQATEIQLLQNQCEQERTQILTNLMLALENPRLAGYMLTGNRSMFLETDGSLAWLYHCPKVHSPLHTMNQCYDKIPILYEGEIRFVDPITRQTYPDAVPQNCSDRIKNLFQLDMDQEDSWYTLTPGIVHQDRPAIFGPKKITPMSAQSLTGSQDAGMCTRNELRGFWDNILINAASRTALKKFSQNLIIYSNSPEGSDGFHYYTPRTEFYVDKMISPEYFKDRFMDTFGPVAYVLEHCGIYFSVFLFFKLIIDVVVMVIRHLEISRMTGASLGFGKTLLSASYNIFLTSVLTSMYDPRAPPLAAVDEERKTLCNEEELHDMRNTPKKKEEHIYPVMSPAQFNQAVTPISPV